MMTATTTGQITLKRPLMTLVTLIAMLFGMASGTNANPTDGRANIAKSDPNASNFLFTLYPNEFIVF